MPERAFERVDIHKLKPFELMVVVLADHGAPMSYEAIRSRIAERGRDISVQSLQKAWHGSPPVRKTVSGDLEVVREIGSVEWDMIVWAVEKALGVDAQSHLRAVQREPVDAQSPLPLDEFRAAINDYMPSTVGLGSLLGLGIEACGGSVDDSGMTALAHELRIHRVPETLQSFARNKRSPIRRGEDGLWRVDGSLPSMEKARRAARELLRRKQDAAEASARATAWLAERKANEQAERAKNELKWLTAAKRYVRTFHLRGEFVAASVLDPDARTFEFCGDQDALRSALASSEIVVGIDPRSDCERLGVATVGREFVDLSPPVKSKTINRSGRKLKITPELIMRSTLGRSDAPGVARKVEADARAGRTDQVRRRLESDLKALHALHDYIQGHRFVRLRWGFINEVLDVAIHPLGQPAPLLRLLKRACYNSQLIEVVLHGPPGWTDPWSRAKRCRVLRMDGWNFELAGDDGQTWMWFPEIYAARVIEAPVDRSREATG